MKINSSELNIMYCKTTQKSYFTKVLSAAIILFFVALIFSSIASGSDQPVENQNDSRHQNLHNLFSDLIAFRREERREIIPLHVVTRYQNDGSLGIIEKSTRMRLLLPTSIDVDGDHRKDIRVWSFRRLALDLNPPAIAIKTTFIIRRLPGMNDIKDDFFEIYLEYEPKVATKFFYLTKDIDRIRLGYQSPANEEIPTTCIITDKAMPHILYPKKKTTHKISVNPGSIVGKEQLNLLFALADMENETVKSELIMQVNYTLAIRVEEIIFEREKTKLFGRGQSLRITRTGVRPSNVTLFIKELMWRNLTIVKQGSITVENIPREINLEWFIGRTGHISIDTHNEEVGRVRAIFNNTVIVGFVPETSMHGRIAWENRTLLGVVLYQGFNLSFDVYRSMILRDFYITYQNQVNVSKLYTYTVEVSASSLLLDLDADVNLGNVIAEYWLFPIIAADTYIINIQNLEVRAENFSIDVKVKEQQTNDTFPSKYDDAISENGGIKGGIPDSPAKHLGGKDITNEHENDNISTEKKLHLHSFVKYLSISADDVRIFLTSFAMINITREAEGILDLYIEDAQSFKNEIITIHSNNGTQSTSTETSQQSYSSLNLSTSGSFASFDALTNQYDESIVTGVDLTIDGYFELHDFYKQEEKNATTNISELRAIGTVDFSIRSIDNDTFHSSEGGFNGNGTIDIHNIYLQDKLNNIVQIDVIHISGEVSCHFLELINTTSRFSNLNIIGSGVFKMEDIYMKNRLNFIMEIDALELTAERSYSMQEFVNETSYPSWFNAQGNGSLVIQNIYRKDPYNNTLEIDLMKTAGEILYSVESSDIYFFDKITASGTGFLEMQQIHFKDSTYETVDIDFIKISGDLSFSLLPPQENPFYSGIIFDGEATLEIQDISSSFPDLNVFDSISIDISGDLKVEQWMDIDSFDNHLMLESQNGFSLNHFSLNFDTGVRFDIERSGSGSFNMSPGYFYTVRNIDTADDGMIFIDSSAINIENGTFSYWSDALNGWGLRFLLPEDFDADGWCLQWDYLYLQLPNIYIPVNWHTYGSKTGRITIEISGDGTHWYHLWPIGGSGSSNQMASNEISQNNEIMEKDNYEKNNSCYLNSRISSTWSKLDGSLCKSTNISN